MRKPSIGPPSLVIIGALALPLVLVGCRSDTGAAPASATAAGQTARNYDRPGYIAFVGPGELWVFERGSDAAARFQREGQPPRSVTLVDAGPYGMDVRSVDRATIDGYLAAEPR